VILTIQPRDPLIVRDGRPFYAFPGAKVRGYSFPPPQVIAGAIRSRVGFGCGYGVGEQDKENWRNLLNQVRILGPVLFSLRTNEALFPAPLDALLIKLNDAGKNGQSDPAAGQLRLYRLAPEEAGGDVATNLPEPLAYPVFAPAEMPKSKPEPMPAFWRIKYFDNWLLGDPATSLEIDEPAELGITGPEVEYRTHVKIDPSLQTAAESMLYETSGLQFLHRAGNTITDVEELALFVQIVGEGLSADCAAAMENSLVGVHPLGGERRLALWETRAELAWPEKPPKEIVEEVKSSKRARLLLLTPADFNTNGNNRPFLPQSNGFGGARAVAAAVGRPITVSGFDLAKGSPKPSRRLTPAGSVYFVDLSSVENIEAWVEEHWMKVLPEQPEQSQRDGYGLTAVGVWR